MSWETFKVAYILWSDITEMKQWVTVSQLETLNPS